MLKKIYFLLLFSYSFFLQGQCMIVPETLENIIASSLLVVEGKVRSQQSYWDTENKNIYTVNEVEIFKIFKGIETVGTVKVVTQGGVVGLQMDQVSNALELEVGDMGMFMLQDFSESLPLAETLYRPTETVLGFIGYDLVTGSARGVFESYTDIANELYGAISIVTGLAILDINVWDTEDTELSGEPSIEESIVSDSENSSNTSFEVHAGIGDLLTITGADFGEEEGQVLFPDANSGGRRYIAALPYQVREWTTDTIIVEVPYRAGTGKIRIDKASGESLLGSDDLPIGYDHINVRYNDGNGIKSYETQLTSDNGNGGYDFQFQADFADDIGASNAFISLIETWGCTTGVNFKIGEVTAVDEDASDGINIVRFDNGDELGGTTLAYARSRYRGCFQGGTIKWFVNEIEVVVNDDYNWYYGDGIPNASQFDFETVMLHEIGHTQQLGHVINSNEVMHFAVGPQQQKRQLSQIDTIGGIFVTDKSTQEQVCGRTLMVHYEACCESIVAVKQPSNQSICQNDTAASFVFSADFADTWQWQQKNGEDWTNLSDDLQYDGTATGNLTVNAPFENGAAFRCIAGNVCDETVTSSTANLSLLSMGFSVSVVQPVCELDGQIIIERVHAEGMLNVSLNGGDSFDYPLNAENGKLHIPASSGSYAIWVEHMDSDCSVDLGTVVLEEPIPLQLSALGPEKINCTNGVGNIKVSFNDHPNCESVLLSIDGGETFQQFDDRIQTVVFENLVFGEYQVHGMWGDGTCLTTSNTARILPSIFPEVAVEVVQPSCEGNIGTFLLTFEPSTDHFEIEISLDGGITYENTFDAQTNSAVVKELPEGEYELWTRWKDENCSKFIGIYRIEKEVLNRGNCKPITVFLNEQGITKISVEDIYDNATEKGCPNVSLELQQTSFTCDDLGKNEVELTITDKNGDATVCTTIVTVKDESNFCKASKIQVQELSLRLYPNPTSDKLWIYMTKRYTVLNFQLFSASGVLVMESFPKNLKEKRHSLNVSHLGAGVYTLNITTESENFVEQVIIE